MAKKKVENTVSESDSGVELVNEDANGQKRIPGTEVAVIKEIQKFVLRHEETKREHKSLSETLEAEDDEAIALYRKHEEHFTENAKGNFVYSDSSGAYLEIVKPSGGLKVKTDVLDVIEPKAATAG